MIRIIHVNKLSEKSSSPEVKEIERKVLEKLSHLDKEIDDQGGVVYIYMGKNFTPTVSTENVSNSLREKVITVLKEKF
jgi:hypothetical protein